jgi:catechol 2,3-dioxygenase-like lactoylglutathione lyase family enzyme
MSPITALVAGVPVSDLDASIDWYTRLFGRRPDMRVGEEVLWDIDEHATLFIEPNAAQAGAGRITFAVAGLDALLERLAGQAHRSTNGACLRCGHLEGWRLEALREAV